MRNTKSLITWLFVLALTGLLAACGSSPVSDSTATATGPAAQGIAVDPYIVGAIFQEVAADGTLLQRQSTASDAAGRFSFSQPLTPGSIVELKPSSKGMHNGAPYLGMIKRRIDANAPATWVVSPLTTLTASGLSDEQVLSLFARAGLTDLTAADLTADPLAAIDLGGTIGARTRLAPLQAAMAANAYLQAVNDYELTAADLNDSARVAIFGTMVTAATEFLSVATFNNLANDAAIIAGETPLSADDLIRTATNLCQQVSDQVRLNPSQPLATAIDNTLASAPIYARQYYEARTGMPGSPPPVITPIPDPVPTPTPAPIPTPDPTPVPVPDGAALYTASCAICHKFASLDAAGFAPDLNNKGSLIAAKLQAGHNGIALSSAGAAALSNWIATNSTVITPAPTPTPDPTPAPAPDGAALYTANCEDCHKFGTIDAAGFAPDLNNKGSLIPAKLQTGHNGVTLSAVETAALGSWIAGNSTVVTPVPDPVPTPDPTPAPAPDGAALYAANCNGCHKFGSLDTAGFAPDLNNKGSLIPAKLQAGHNGIALSAAETAALGSWIVTNSIAVVPVPDPVPTPNPTPVPAPDGAALYAASCNGCHKFGSVDTAGFAPDLNNQGSLINTKLQAGHNGIALSTAETTALATWITSNSIAVTPVPDPVPVPDPTTPPDGASLYAIECAGCHGNLASTNKPGRTATQTQNAITANLGGMGGIILTTAELQAIADALATVTPPPAPGPDYSDCTACHRQPPNGSAAPNRAGAHAVHSALPGVGTTCSVCHTGAAHNGWVDLGFPAAYNTKTGAAADNPNGTATCTNISCHGGKTTPDWSTGIINVNTQCTSCHAYGTTQYNSYASGKHSKSDHSREACTVCHNTTSLASSHFSRLNTTALEGPASATIGGGSTRVSSYNAGTKTCMPSCHGSERW